MEMDTLTAPLLKELIDRIEVSEVQGKGKNRTQRIVIHYRFAGYIDLERELCREQLQTGHQTGRCHRIRPARCGIVLYSFQAIPNTASMAMKSMRYVL